MNNNILYSEAAPNNESWCIYTLKEPVMHRHHTFVEYAEWEDGVAHKINNIRYFTVKLNDDKWWLIPYSSRNDDLMEDIGPYETPADALFAGKLMET